MSFGGEDDIRFHQDTKTIFPNANAQIRCSVRMRASIEQVPAEKEEPSLAIKITLNERSQRFTATSHGYIYKIEDSKVSKKMQIFEDKLHQHCQRNRSTRRLQIIMCYFNVHPRARKLSAEILAIGASGMAERAMIKACKELHVGAEINIVTSSLVQDDGDVDSMATILTGSPVVPISRSSIEALEGMDLESNGSKCVICQDEFLGGVGILRMPCSHIFHDQCIIRWLGERHVCPVCRFEMPVKHMQKS